MGASPASGQQMHPGLLLPSNKAWRTSNYFRLVARQRELTVDAMSPEEAGPKWEVTPREVARRRRPSSPPPELLLRQGHGPAATTAWSFSDLCKAACLLAAPPQTVSFHDEEEMRRVYSLIYDVFRYKNILNQALINVAFFVKYPEERPNHVWLLLYDLYNRGFADAQDKQLRQQVFASCLTGDLNAIDGCLSRQQVRLGAAVARIRIKNNALKLCQLLPSHLRDEKVVALDEAPVTGWVNTFLAECSEVGALVERAGLVRASPGHGRPGADEYRWDDACPGFLAWHASRRVDLAQSSLVRRHRVVLQDRAFCLGSAALARILQDLQLAGAVVQTHINSPRTTAYLACLLHGNRRVERLLAFGAGHRKQEYEDYLQQLDVRNAVVYAERFVDAGADLLPRLERVCAVLASPPNTYSGVLDPVDLVCSRGGDLAMLEVLADPESGSRDRVSCILQEQRLTLQLSMSQPQVQVVLYETHSIVAAENGDMVARLVAEMNGVARLKHVEEWEGDEPPPRPEDVFLPDCDVFQLGELPPMCDQCFRLDDEGCYLALIRRKEITRLDAKYMIKMAEMRGLFGGGERGAKRSAASSRRERKKPRAGDEELDEARRSGRRRKVHVDRIAAQTHASSMRRATRAGEAAACGRQHSQGAPGTDPLARGSTRFLSSAERDAVTRRLSAPTEASWRRMAAGVGPPAGHDCPRYRRSHGPPASRSLPATNVYPTL